MNTYPCKICGKSHEGPPLSYGAAAPGAYYDVPEEEREKRCLLTSEQCVIDDRYYFILGNINLPITDREEIFNWAVWVLLSEEDFYRISELWETPGRENEPPYDGLLSTTLPCYPSTFSLKVNVYTKPVGERPIVELQESDHPLMKEQKEGISRERVEEFASMILHLGTANLNKGG
jgi:hypothetical protein